MKFESTINGGSLARVGIILALCGAAFWFVQARGAAPSAPATSGAHVESAPVELLPGVTIWIDTVIGQVPLTIVSIANGQATLTDADGDEHVMSANALAWGSMADDADQVDKRAAIMAAVVAKRYTEGWYKAHAPAGWCNAADCPPVRTVQAPARVTNYAPEHWTPEARAALQYPAARAAQQWANEHLYNR